MRRTDKLVEISRRDFCAFASLGLVVAGCTDGSSGVVQTGPLGTEPDAPQGSPPDARPGSPDARPGNPDAAGGPVCGSGATDVGAASTFVSGSPKRFSSGYFVVRDSGGLYAVSSICTHEGATCTVSSGVFYCPRHGAEFTFNGDVISGPVFTGLVHYAMCFMPNGNVGVIKSQQVSQSQRLVA
jgi:cytochrome b6-f complex iron-sulfur subunit